MKKLLRGGGKWIWLYLIICLPNGFLEGCIYQAEHETYRIFDFL